ncbi:MAG: ABC transporter ATP-binding protein [Candidatus Promineofilum sp.]|nr:ABC transporter ATP-binding protein [Promineifilum sp.]
MTPNAVTVSDPTGEQVTTPQPVALRCRGLVKHFAQQPVVRGVSFVVAPGDILVLVGPSGCGKTTTLRLLAGFERLDSGLIEIDGRIVADDERHLPPERRRVGMVFQDYALFPHLTVGQNVGFALGKSQPDRERISQLLTFVGLPGQEQKMPHELSGGEQQRVSLARALSTRPAILLLDEPFSNLDASLRAEMRSEVRSLLKSSGTTAVFVTHDQEEALLLGDQVGVMRDGQLEQIGTPEDIFHRPQTRFVAEFLGQTRFMHGLVAADGISCVLGHLSRRASSPVGSEVEIALRPDDVTFAADEDGDGRVLSRRFTGISYLYQIGLPDGTIVQSLQPHEMRVKEGTAVRVHFTAEASPPVFYHGQAL